LVYLGRTIVVFKRGNAGREHLDESFFERPILNSPYAYPPRHWELDPEGQPTNQIIETRRRSELITPVPKPQRRRRALGQVELELGAGDGLSSASQEYNPDTYHQ
jgi:type III restriction enzyme